MNSRDHSTTKPDKPKLRRQQTAGKCPRRLFVFVSQPASIIRGLSGNSLATWSYLPYSVRSELINTSRVKIHFKPPDSWNTSIYTNWHHWPTRNHGPRFYASDNLGLCPLALPSEYGFSERLGVSCRRLCVQNTRPPTLFFSPLSESN